MARKWTASEVVGAGVVCAAVAAVVVLIAAGPAESDSGPNSPDLVCDPLLQPFAVTAWVVSFAFTALWLLTHCESCPPALSLPLEPPSFGAVLLRRAVPCQRRDC